MDFPQFSWSNDEGFHFRVSVWEETNFGALKQVRYVAQATVSRDERMYDWALGFGEVTLSEIVLLAAPSTRDAAEKVFIASFKAARTARIDAMTNLILKKARR